MNHYKKLKTVNDVFWIIKIGLICKNKMSISPLGTTIGISSQKCSKQNAYSGNLMYLLYYIFILNGIFWKWQCFIAVTRRI